MVNQEVDLPADKLEDGSFAEETFCYESGLTDYVGEIVGDASLTNIQYWETEQRGRDRADKDEYRVKLSVAFCFSNRVKFLEYYHNSPIWYGGSPREGGQTGVLFQE